VGTQKLGELYTGLAVLFPAVVVRKALISRPIAYLMGIAGLTFLVQGWLAGAENFRTPHVRNRVRRSDERGVDDVAAHRGFEDAESDYGLYWYSLGRRRVQRAPLQVCRMVGPPSWVVM
jgi:hypothetical protein